MSIQKFCPPERSEWKGKVYTQFHRLLREKADAIQQLLNDLKEAGSNETKSTAGDKHETALAMLQIEQENKRKQLRDAVEQLRRFERLDPTFVGERVSNGSLVKTNRGWLLIGVAAGKIMVDDLTVTAISPESPLGGKLIGLASGAIARVNNIEYYIENIE
jgi:hypothetical protein